MKLLSRIMIIVPLLFLSLSIKTYSEKSGDYITFVAEDAAGNLDSVRIILHDDATEGIDTNLNETNIIGTSNDILDIRLLQRDTNHCNYPAEQKYWLCGLEMYIKSFSSDIDLKYDYRPIDKDRSNNEKYEFVIKLHASNYPVEIRLGESNFTDLMTLLGLFDEDNQLIGKSLLEDDEYSPRKYYVFDHDSSNMHIGIWLVEGIDTSVNDLFETNHLSIYPNPCGDMVSISNLDNTIHYKDNRKYHIIDYNGIIHRTFSLLENPQLIDLSFMRAGSYILFDQNYQTIIKLVKN